MRILVVYSYFGTPAGSWSTRVYELTKRWVSNGNLVEVITAPYPKSDIVSDGFISSREIEGIKVTIIDAGDDNKKNFFLRAVNAILFSTFSIIFALIKKYDVIIVSSGPITVGGGLILAKVIRSKKTIFEVRDLWPDGAVELGIIKNKLLKRLAYSFESLCYHFSDLVVPCSEGMNKSIIDRFPNTKTFVAPHACNLTLFGISGNERITKESGLTDKKIFLYTGSIGLMDDCIQIVQAFELIKDPSVVMVFIGDGVERKLLEEYVRKQTITNVIFLGLIPKFEVAEWLANATASIITFKDLPVLQTSSPNKLFDALASGCPIIQNTNGWIKDLLIEHKCGINVPANNPHVLAESILQIANNPEIRNKMGENAGRLAREKYDIEHISKAYLDQIENIFKGSSNSSK